MGVYTFTGTCMCCKRLFSFHPNKVPSLNGQPICKECVDKANLIRVQKGLPPITYAPDAYKPALDEDEDRIDWKE
jgi:hypothetical protein